MRTNAPRWLRLVLLAGFALAGCTYVRVENNSAVEAVVLLRLPDRTSPVTLRLPPFQAATKLTNSGGTYSVTVLPQQAYIDLLQRKQDELVQSLFDFEDELSPAEAQAIKQRIHELMTEMAELYTNAPSCSNKVEEFSTANAQVFRDPLASPDKWETPLCYPGIAEEGEGE